MPLYSPCHQRPCQGNDSETGCPSCGRTFPTDLVALANVAAGYSPMQPPVTGRPQLFLVPTSTGAQEAS